MFPSLSATSPCGPELGVLRGYSLNSPVFGSSRPNLFAPCPVYQSEPSGATAGSWGRDFGVGTSYSWISTFSIPTVAKPTRVTASKKKDSARRDIECSPLQKIVVLRVSAFTDGTFWLRQKTDVSLLSDLPSEIPPLDTMPCEGELMSNLAGVVQQLQKERSRVAKDLQRLDSALAALNGEPGKRTGIRTLSAAARARIAAAQRARWAKVRSGQNQKVVTMPKKRTMSAAARKRIAAAQRARWAKVRASR